MADPSRVITGLFPDRDSAERACQGVIDRGYTEDDVNLAMSDATRDRHFGKNSNSDIATGGVETELGNKAAEDAGIGAGGAAGTLVGALIGMGIPEERVKRYESGIEEGGMLMHVRPRNDDADADDLARQWQDARGADIHR